MARASRPSSRSAKTSPPNASGSPSSGSQSSNASSKSSSQSSSKSSSKSGTSESGFRPSVPARWLRRLITEEGERLPVHDLDSRTHYARTVGRILEPSTRRLLGRRGLALGTLLEHWEAIVGPTVARQCVPLKLVMPRKGAKASLGGVLHVKAAAGAIATDLMHRAPLICERLNATLGYRAVERLQVLQGPLPGRPRKGRRPLQGSALPPPPLPADQHATLQERLAQVDDPELRAALERLGKAVFTPRR